LLAGKTITHRRSILIIGITFWLILGYLLVLAYADIIFLKNGRNIEGIIKSETEDSLVLDVGFGTVTFLKNEIRDIYRSTKKEVEQLRNQWQLDKVRARQAQESYQRQPRQLALDKKSDHIMVKVLLNGKVGAELVLDTGASFVVLSFAIARKLGIDLDKQNKTVDMVLADGRKVKAKFLLLDTVTVKDVTAENVEAAVMPEGMQDESLGDGILGMSFLKRFNFKVDNTNGRIILEKI